jgi:rod shape determining protein RodA
MSYLEYRVKTVPTGWRKILFINWGLVALIIGAAASGFVMLISVAGGSLDPWASAQMQRFSIGLVAMFVIAMTPIWIWRNVSVPIYIVALLLLLLVEFLGSTGMGAQRWINLGFINLQPSEVAKIALVMLMAAYYDWLPNDKVSRPFWVLVPLIFISLPVLLVIQQPDLGTSILLLLSGGNSYVSCWSALDLFWDSNGVINWSCTSAFQKSRYRMAITSRIPVFKN